MKAIDIYTNITGIIEKILKDDNLVQIKELIGTNELRSYDYIYIKALLKHLIKIGKLTIVENKDKRFEEFLVKWNPSGDLQFPLHKKLRFDEVKVCVTFPPFNIYGLTDFFEEKQISIASLIDEFNGLFNTAHKNIKICSPFLEWNGFSYFSNILLSKSKNGIKLQILSREIREDENKNRFEEIKRIYNLFKQNTLEHFLEIRNYYFLTEDKKLASSIHAKLIIVDDDKAYIGSGELRENSFKKNLEVGLILSGQEVKILSLIFDNLFQRAEVISFE